MVTPASVKGHRGERDVVTYLHVCGHPAERLRLSGVVNRGDLWVPSMNHRLEVKNYADTYTAISMGALQADKLQRLCPDETVAAIVARRGKGVGDWYYVRLVKHVFGEPPPVTPVA